MVRGALFIPTEKIARCKLHFKNPPPTFKHGESPMAGGGIIHTWVRKNVGKGMVWLEEKMREFWSEPAFHNTGRTF